MMAANRMTKIIMGMSRERERERERALNEPADTTIHTAYCLVESNWVREKENKRGTEDACLWYD